MTEYLWVLERYYILGLYYASNRDLTGTGVERVGMTCSKGQQVGIEWLANVAERPLQRINVL